LISGARHGWSQPASANGVIAQTQHVDTQEAFRRMRDFAHLHHQHLTDVAREVVSGQTLPAARADIR